MSGAFRTADASPADRPHRRFFRELGYARGSLTNPSKSTRLSEAAEASPLVLPVMNSAATQWLR